MNISLRRLSHLWLAIVSSLFLFIASVTGVVLALEPVVESSYPYRIKGSDQLPISELVRSLKKSYPEISSIKRDHNGFIQVVVFGELGEQRFYVNPMTGKKLGELLQTPTIFSFSRTLHRSLFFGKTGRFLVGITSFLLLLIAISGFALTLKKEGGFKNYFKKSIREGFYPHYHTLLGKLLMVFVLCISITGVCLFLKRFSVIPTSQPKHAIDFEQLKEAPVQPSYADFPGFQNHRVGSLKEVIFPFSDFVDDFFELKLENKELLINQLTGETISQVQLATTKKLLSLSFTIHTAEGQPWWAVMLGLSSVGLLFLMFSGFRIYAKRSPQKVEPSNPFSREESTIILGYGSETGGTLVYAQALHEALLRVGEKSYLMPLNAFDHYPSMQQLFILTSTYGKLAEIGVFSGAKA